MGNLRGHNNIGKLITKTNSAENQFGLCGGKSQSVRSQKTIQYQRACSTLICPRCDFSMDRNLHSTGSNLGLGDETLLVSPSVNADSALESQLSYLCRSKSEFLSVIVSKKQCINL